MGSTVWEGAWCQHSSVIGAISFLIGQFRPTIVVFARLHDPNDREVKSVMNAVVYSLDTMCKTYVNNKRCGDICSAMSHV